MRAKRVVQLRRRVLGVLGAVALVSWVGGLWIEQDWGGMLLNLGTELAGAALTYWLLEKVIGGEETLDDLIAQMGSSVREVAIPALEELTRQGRVRDGSLVGKSFPGASLEKAQLSGADLRGAFLAGATLIKANLGVAKLMGANLTFMDLTGANLSGANLKGALLFGAKTEGADLRGVTLPDGTPWAPNADIRAFVAPPPPNFVRLGRRRAQEQQDD